MKIEKLLDGLSRIKIGLFNHTIDGERIATYLEVAQNVIKSYQWVPASERLPDKVEYETATVDGQYFSRLEIAVQTDTIEYYIGYFDGYKWFDKRYQSFEGDVVAWKIHKPYQP
ncbi:hypothetical protein 10S8_16 [uncultured Caudovirales phage]|uniref:Uncharacterized protein n=1 Tax=uncultured Caudovirales phage TaxID=2100421 RepID=A0A2H4J8I7_9CAUD|nr:hypothetical protein 10S8_16 [uncultured Caudovirales phage]